MKIKTEEDLVTESDVVETLMDAYQDYCNECGVEDTRIQGTFDGLGYLTRNKGFTIRVGSQEFQITVNER